MNHEALISAYYLLGSIVIALCTQYAATFIKHGKTLEEFSLHVRKRWFLSFYCCAYVLALVLVHRRANPRLIYFSIHIYRRLIESIFIMPYDSKSKMHLLHLLMGLSFYIVTTYNFFLQAVFPTSNLWATGFIILNILQLISHAELGKLRKNWHEHVPIPRRGIFKYLLCPHYLFELLLYSLFCLPFSSTSMRLNFLFVATNLFSSSHDTIQWHRKNFGKDDRYAIIPLIL